MSTLSTENSHSFDAIEGLGGSLRHKNSLIRGTELQAHRLEPLDALDLEGKEEFKDIFAKFYDDVNIILHDADAEVQRYAAGETEDMHTLTLAMDKAEKSFQLMMQLTSRIVEAYKEVKNMQV